MMIKVQATSYTTGQRKEFILDESVYTQRFTLYPAWNFHDETMCNVFQNK